MTSVWDDCSLGDLLFFSNGKTSPERTDSGRHPVFGSNGQIGWADVTNAPADTIVVGRVGSYCGSLKFSSCECWVTDNAVIATARELNHPKFLYYLMETLNLHSWRGGSGQPLLNQRTLSSIPTKCPHPTEQRAIAGVLGALDDKIEQNRRTAAGLEKLARAVFRAWFVDFEPVHAKAAGAASFPGMPQAVFDSLPTRLVDSELGPIPEGWGVERLDSLLTLHYGKSLTKTVRQPGDVPVYGSGGLSGTHNQALASGPGIIVGRKGSVGTLYWESRDFFPIDTTFYVEPKAGLGMHYLFELLRTLGLETMNTDAAVPGLNRDNAYRLESAVPTEGVANYFEDFASELRRMISQTETESTKLAELRDYLLPKLLSGEVRVKAQGRPYG